MTIESIEGVATLVVTMKITKKMVGRMKQVGAVDSGYVNQVDHGMS